MNAEEEYAFECPHCFETISIRIDHSGGSHQQFTYDCEVCCRPITIALALDRGDVLDFRAEPES